MRGYANPAMVKDTSNQSEPARRGQANSAVDYNFEHGLLAWTAAYHIKRGVCYGSGYRHCPYEAKHVEGNTETRPQSWPP